MLEINEKKLLLELQFADSLSVMENKTYYVVMNNGHFYPCDIDGILYYEKPMWRFDAETDEIHDWIFGKGIENARDCIFEVYNAYYNEKYGRWKYDANRGSEIQYLEELYNRHDEAIRLYYADIVIDEKRQSGYYSNIIEQIKTRMEKGVACTTLLLR